MEYSKENVESFNKMTNRINNNTRNILISNQITMCTMILGELSEDINLVIDAINDCDAMESMALSTHNC